MDFVQWTGPSPPQDPNNWDKITYKYDPSGRRIRKTVDGYKTTYCHDGGHEIAEYDGNGNLLRKYVYGPGVDQPICMIEVADSNAVSYYHFDGLGSVVALTNSSGTTIQTYEYTVYGQVAASDPNFTNPFMFTGRRFDFETGLYYYRARYYNPYIGRFLQTDPVGYGYGYCGNNPLSRVDPLGLYYTFLDPDHPDAVDNRLTWAWIDDYTHEVTVIDSYANLDAWCDAPESERFTFGPRPTVGRELSQNVVDNCDDGVVQDSNWLFERLQAIYFLSGYSFACLDQSGVSFIITDDLDGNWYSNGVVSWNPNLHYNAGGLHRHWGIRPSLVALAHELSHAVDFLCQPHLFTGLTPEEIRRATELSAVAIENDLRYAFFKLVPGWDDLWPRADYTGRAPDVGLTWYNSLWWGADNAWYYYWNGYPQQYYY